MMKKLVSIVLIAVMVLAMTACGGEISTMEDVQRWYEKQIPAVEKMLKKYAKETVDGFSDFKIETSEFYFGESDPWYDCFYMIDFSCKVNGQECSGRARGFMNLGAEVEEIEWFQFQINRYSDWESIVDIYDKYYGMDVEDYYFELERLYG